MFLVPVTANFALISYLAHNVLLDFIYEGTVNAILHVLNVSSKILSV